MRVFFGIFMSFFLFTYFFKINLLGFMFIHFGDDFQVTFHIFHYTSTTFLQIESNKGFGRFGYFFLLNALSYFVLQIIIPNNYSNNRYIIILKVQFLPFQATLASGTFISPIHTYTQYQHSISILQFNTICRTLLFICAKKF